MAVCLILFTCSPFPHRYVYITAQIYEWWTCFPKEMFISSEVSSEQTVFYGRERRLMHVRML